MADTKITGLQTPQVTTNPATDVLPIVNIADNSMAASGSTRKITVNQLLGAGGTATLASATITGDLTVDTNTLKVDSANNRVGIGTATPAASLHVASGNVRLSDSAQVEFGGSTNSISGSNASNLIEIYTNNLRRHRIDSNGVATWSNVGGVAGDTMTLNSTGLGIGVTPSALSGFGTTLRQKGVGAAGGIFTENNTGASWFGIYSGTSTSDAAAVTFTDGGSLRFAKTTAVGVTGFTELLRLKNGGQLRFVPLAADPAGAEAGDVYYNSTSNKLKCYNGTTWNDLF